MTDIRKIFKCESCDQLIDPDEHDDDEIGPVYECGECGNIFNRTESEYGNHRCDCGRFAAKQYDHGCPDCHEELIEVLAVEMEDGELIEIDEEEQKKIELEEGQLTESEVKDSDGPKIRCQHKIIVDGPSGLGRCSECHEAIWSRNVTAGFLNINDIVTIKGRTWEGYLGRVLEILEKKVVIEVNVRRRGPVGKFEKYNVPIHHLGRIWLNSFAITQLETGHRTFPKEV